MSESLIAESYRVLKIKCRHFAAPGESRPVDDARLVFAFWNCAERRIERGAGFMWVRRTWEAAPEPTVLMGFDRSGDIRNGSEGFMLAMDGISYVELPAQPAAIQLEIDRVRRIQPEGLNSVARERNAADFADALRGWRHSLNNLQSALLAGRTKLISTALPDSRRREFEVLSEMGPHIVGRLAESFSRLCRDQGIKSTLIDENMVAVNGLLTASIADWQLIKAITQQEFSEPGATKLSGKLANLGARLELIQDVIQAILRLLPSPKAPPGSDLV